MNLRDMTPSECEAVLAAHTIGHLGCSTGDRPYVIPIRYVFRSGSFYSFSLPGRKIDTLRANPQACVQVETLKTAEDWQSVLLEGRFQELPDDETWHGEHTFAWSLLQEKGNWWEPGAYKPGETASSGEAPLPVFYSIQIESLSGRQATQD